MTEESGAAEAAPEAAPLTVDQAAEAVAEAPSEPVEPVQEPEEEAAEPEAATSDGAVRVVVTEAGHGVIFKGELIGGVEQTFAAGDAFEASGEAAAIHEAKGLVTRA